MLTQNERRVVESIRQAKHISIIVDCDGTNELQFSPREGRPDINRLTGDIAVAVQSYINKRHNE